MTSNWIIVLLLKDYYKNGQNHSADFFFKNDHWGREKGPSNYTPGMDFLDYGFL